MSRADTHRDLHELFNARDFDGIAKRTAKTFEYRDHPRNLTISSAEGFLAWLQEWVDALDGRATEATYLDAGDVSIARFIGAGVNDGPMGPFPATGKPVRFPLCELLSYDPEGLVTGGEIYYDQVTVLAQLGHLQLPG